MKIPVFHNNGKLMRKLSVQVFIENPAKPSDSFIGAGYGIQVNTANPNVEFDIASNGWVSKGSVNSGLLAFQQNVLQIGQNGTNNDVLWWNRNSLLNHKNVSGVEYGVTILPKNIWGAYQEFGKKPFDCVQLDIETTGMSIKLIENLNVIYEAKSLPQRYIVGSLPTQLIDTPISPWTLFQIRIVGFGSLSHSIFSYEAVFGVHILCDSEFQFNLIDSDKSMQENLDCFVVGGLNCQQLTTGETSNLSCDLIGNNWRGNELYYRCKV